MNNLKRSLAQISGGVLSREQMKKITGGSTECNSCSKDECKGSCTTGGDTCGWVTDTCKCTYLAGNTM